MTRLDTLEPEFRARVEQLLTEAEKATGRKWGVAEGRRTLSRQAALYEQGRKTAGKVVTNARPGESAHNFGEGADLVPLDVVGQFDWNAPTELFRQMADLAGALGLTPGFYFRSFFDAPHVESADWREAQAAWRRGELRVA